MSWRKSNPESCFDVDEVRLIKRTRLKVILSLNAILIAASRFSIYSSVGGESETRAKQSDIDSEVSSNNSFLGQDPDEKLPRENQPVNVNVIILQ